MAISAQNLVSLQRTACKTFADRPVFGGKAASEWRWMSYADFGHQVDRCCAALAAAGIGRQDRVSVVANNRSEWAILAYATFALGAVIVPMYEAQPLEEWHYILRDSQARIVVASRPDIFGELRRFQRDLPALEHVFGMDIPADDPASFDAFLARGQGCSPPTQEPEPDTVAACIYTSGTTGPAKGVLLSHKNFCANIDSIHAALPMDGDTTLSFLPWAHAFGQTCDLHAQLAAGTSIAINDEVSRLLDNLATVRPTLLCAVPRIFHRVYERVHERVAGQPAFLRRLFHDGVKLARARRAGQRLGPWDALRFTLADRLIFAKTRRKLGGRLRYVVSGSAALSLEVAQFIDALGITIYEGYGLTEATPVVSVNRPGASRIGTVGPPLPGVRVVIDESQGDQPGQGEIIVYGNNVMLGYHQHPEATRERLTADGGCRTGDLGYIDPDGFLCVTGRLSEQYKLENGKFVVPSPIEEQLKLSPFIANAVLVGHNRPHNVALIVPDFEAVTRWAEQAAIAVENLTTSPAVRDLLKTEIERMTGPMRSFERPRAFEVISEDFTIANGLLTQTLKVRRDLVVKQYAAQIEALYASPSVSTAPASGLPPQ